MIWPIAVPTTKRIRPKTCSGSRWNHVAANSPRSPAEMRRPPRDNASVVGSAAEATRIAAVPQVAISDARRVRRSKPRDRPVGCVAI